jgi:uncharacterized protein with PIN domain
LRRIAARFRPRHHTRARICASIAADQRDGRAIRHRRRMTDRVAMIDNALAECIAILIRQSRERGRHCGQRLQCRRWPRALFAVQSVETDARRDERRAFRRCGALLRDKAA